MEVQEITFRRVLLWLAIVVLLSWLIAYSDREKEYVIPSSVIPAKPEEPGDYYYDFNKEKWESLYSNPRANGVKAPEQPNTFTEEDLEDHLEKNVDGYLEDTYWGEEYDIDND